ncbi:MAG TPA: hypothetical protein VGQ58_03530 [Candidatus Limnocylindrales bacterium]|nr:hypothetical protein [Candidatus Limnocylindrales bacterium]
MKGLTVAAGLAALLALAVVLLPLVPAVGGSAPVLAASPDASPAPGGGGDPRSVGEGPGLVGNPVLAVLLVLAIGAVAAGLTVLYVRATGGPGRRPPTRPPGRGQG